MSIEVLRYAAFTDEGRGGNPAGVVLGTSLTDAQMLAVAQAIGYSETAFLTHRDGRSVIRFFSPRAEVDFCGHATIATAVAVAQRDGARTLSLATNAGPVEVRTSVDIEGTVTATLTSPATSTVVARRRTSPEPAEVRATAGSSLHIGVWFVSGSEVGRSGITRCGVSRRIARITDRISPNGRFRSFAARN